MFDGIADNQQIWFLLMTHNYDKLANHMVNFKNRTHEEKVAFLQKRVRSQHGPMPRFFHIENRADVERTARKTTVPVEEELRAE